MRDFTLTARLPEAEELVKILLHFVIALVGWHCVPAVIYATFTLLHGVWAKGKMDPVTYKPIEQQVYVDGLFAVAAAYVLLAHQNVQLTCKVLKLVHITHRIEIDDKMLCWLVFIECHVDLYTRQKRYPAVRVVKGTIEIDAYLVMVGERNHVKVLVFLKYLDKPYYVIIDAEPFELLIGS